MSKLSNEEPDTSCFAILKSDPKLASQYVTTDCTLESNNRGSNGDYDNFFFDDIERAKYCIDILIDKEPERWI